MPMAWRICTYEDTVDAEAYIDILERHVLPSRHCLCQQDNIRPGERAWVNLFGINPENLCSFAILIKVEVNDQITDFSFCCHFESVPTFWEFLFLIPGKQSSGDCTLLPSNTRMFLLVCL